MKSKGSILMISLWVLAILVVFVIGLGNRALINLKLARSQKDRLTAALLAHSGVEKAILLLNTTSSAVAEKYDSLTDSWSTGINPDTKSYILKEIELKKGSGAKFTVGFLDQANDYRCMSDEESKININYASTATLTGLLTKGGVDTGVNELVNYILYWRNDPALDLTLTYPELKKDKFSNREELITVLEYFYKGKTADYQKKAWDIFKQLEGLVTVYSASAAVNVNTVSPQALAVITGSLAADADEVAAASTLTEKIITLRNTQLVKGEEDIRTGAQLSTAEGNFLNKLTGGLVYKSNTFCIESSANSARTQRRVSVVYDRQNKKIVFWRQI
ncbi:MAG: type II secretion system protein GspK [Candidatus Omnitrophica bacterium]|nr:type II secretion system protein GspK [Candidatus Omnitrophota bacterium]